MREKILKSKLYKLILWVTLFSMGGGAIIFSPFLFKQNRSGIPIIATLNGDSITQKEFEQTLIQQMEKIALIEQQYGQYAQFFLKMLGLDDPRQLALQTLLHDTLLNQVASKLYVDFSGDFIAEKLKDPTIVLGPLREYIPMHALEKDGTVNLAMLTNSLHRRGQSLADFEDSIENALRRNIVTDLVGTTVFISQQEIKDYFSMNFLKHKFGIIQLSYDHYIKNARNQPITDDQLEKFFAQQNQASKRYWTDEVRSVITWRFKPQNYGITVEDKQVEQYYNANRHKEFLASPMQVSFRKMVFNKDSKQSAQAAIKKAEELHQKLAQDSTQFEDLARQHSEDQETAQAGGFAGFISKGSSAVSPIVEQAVFKLKNDGDVSPIINTNEQVLIIQRVEKKPATFKPLDAVKKDIAKHLVQQKFKQLFADQAQQAIDSARENETKKESIAQFARDKKAAEQPLSNLKNDNTLLAQKVFKVRKDGVVAFVDKDGDGVIAYIADIQKPYEPFLDQVKQQVQDDVYREKAIVSMRADLQKARELLQHNSPSDVAKMISGKLINTELLSHDDSALLDALREQKIPVEQLLFAHEAPAMVTLAEQDDNFYLAKIIESQPFDNDLFKAKRNEIEATLYKQKKEFVLRGFIASLYKNATIKFIENSDQSRNNVPLDI